MSEGKSHCSTSKSPGEIIVNLGYIRMLQCPVGYHTEGKKIYISLAVHCQVTDGNKKAKSTLNRKAEMCW